MTPCAAASLMWVPTKLLVAATSGGDVIYSMRHYRVRLRRSKRPPYVIARAVLVFGVIVCVLLAARALHVLGN